MSGRGEDSDSDAPEELTAIQGIQKDEELRKVETENKARVVREGKERRRQWAQKLTPRPTQNDESIEDTKEPENAQDSDNIGMLPDEIVKIIAAREKKVFSSDSEEEEHEKKPTSKKKRSKSSGSGPVILKDLPPPPCLENSLEFLKKRKMQVSRSSAVLNNSSQALRLLSTSGLLRNK
ncbi:hypothetical protein K7X08_017472 [Anisodus acutangulus]|uniref:Uncharacterized protein n=1 Tax=Anisodus acutangulus TaxID=402998 RepID=A0A9Q1R6D9_9SOLA|nr:hypothetical protein K7X08_017472 [Anisodus acutangulus]